MTLANGIPYLAIPGPSVMPDAVLRAMHRPAPNIYSGELHDLVASLFPDLRAIARTRHHAAIYITNGHGTWEAALANTLSRGDLVLCPTTGIFGHGWANMAEAMHIRTQRLDFGRSDPIDMDRVEAALRADPDHQIKAVLAVHVDTSSSVRCDIPALRAVLDKVGHPALLMADCMASLGCDEIHMDEWGIDVLLAGCQKGLMTPPGLGFLFFNPKAEAARTNADLATGYWDWRPRAFSTEFYQHFCGTAPTHHLYGLRAALDMIIAEGLPNVWARHATLSRAIWAAFDTWGQAGAVELNVRNPAHRGHSVTSIRTLTHKGTEMRNWLSENAGTTLGIGLGMATQDDPTASDYFRLGHMGHVNAQMVMGALGTINMGLKAVGIPHAPGGLEAAATVLASDIRSTPPTN